MRNLKTNIKVSRVMKNILIGFTGKSLLILGLMLFSKLAYPQLSQNVRISDVDIKYNDERVTVPYTIINGSQSDRYFVWVEFFNAKNEKINASTLTGDINTVKGVGGKVIDWDIKRDGMVMNENIRARVSAKLLPTANTSKAYKESTIFPGKGDYQFNQGKPYWIIGAVGYGLLGSSAMMYFKSNSSYDKYMSSTLPGSTDPNFKSAQSQRKTSIIMAGIGISMWFLDYAGITYKSHKQKNIKPQVIMNDPAFALYAGDSPSRRINTRGLPPNLFAELNFTDDNNNGILEAREKAELSISISNMGKGDAMQLEVIVADSTFDKSMNILNASQKINAIKAGETIKLKIPISTDINLSSAKHKLMINVTEHYGFDMDPAYLMLNTYAYQPPRLAFSGFEIIDSGIGTGGITEDGQLQAGEQVKAKLVVQNTGQDIAKGTTYSVACNDQNIFLDNSEGTLGDLKPGEVKEFYITLAPNKRVKTTGSLPIFLNMKEEIGKGNLSNFQLPIALNQKPPKANIVNIRSDVESLKKNVARFEYTSNKFKTNIANVANISAVAPSLIKRPNSVGIIFGISNYSELPPAPYADNDAKVMKEYFEKVLGVEQVISYTNNQASGFIFDDVFNPDNGELQRAVVKGVTEIFVFYSGHGIPDKTGENVYLFPSDGKISRLENQGYNIEKLYQNLSKLGAKHVTVILDACFSGGSRKTEKVQTENLIAQKGVKVRPKNTWLGDSNFTIISSSTGEETSLGFDASETGLFTYYICAGLQGKADANNDKAITLGELREYVIQNVMETSKKISGLQTPIFNGDDSLVLANY